MSKTDTGSDATSHHSGTGKGEEKVKEEGKEPGRHDQESSGAGRPSGGSTARDSTRVNPDSRDPIDPESPKMPPA